MKKLLLFVLALTLCFAMAACSQSPKAETETETSAAAEVSDSSESNASADAEAPAYKDHVTIALNYQLSGIDPNTFRSTATGLLNKMVFDTLLNYNYETKEIESELATAWEWTDDSVTRLKVTLRDDVLFHNGEKMTSADVANSLDRNTIGMVTDYYDHCEIVDDYNLEIVLSKPDVDFLYVLTDPSTSITCKSAIEADPDYGFTIGTGPWVDDMSAYVPGERWELIRNENYWGELPETKTVTLRLISDASARLIALQNGEVDVITHISPSEIEAAKADSSLTIEQFPSAGMVYLSFNNGANGPAADDLNLRQAVARAINRDDIVYATGNTTSIPRYTFWGSQMKYGMENFDLDLSYNLEEAKKLADGAKTKELHLMAETGVNEFRNTALVLQEVLRQIGIDLVIDEVDSAGMTANTAYDNAQHESLISTVNLNPWDSDMNKMLTPGSRNNDAILDNARISELLDLAVATADETERAAYYAEVQTIIHDNCYYIPLYSETASIGYVNGTSGINIVPGQSHDYSYVKIAVN